MLATALAALTTTAAGGPSAACTAAEKESRSAIAAAYRKQMSAERKAYFAKVKDPKKRAAFVKRQQAKLKALQAAAACTVPALPPSSSGTCSFMLAGNAEATRLERSSGFPFLSEGPITADGSLPPRGQVDAAMIFVDFADAPAAESIGAIAPLYTAYLDWFREVSYGRFSVVVTPVPQWFRMPRPAHSYGSLYGSPSLDQYVADAIAASDATVDYSRYQSVWIVPSLNSRQVANTGYSRFPGRGVPVDGTEMRFAMISSALFRDRGFFPSVVANHEFLHTMGLADLYGGDSSPLGRWDPMYGDPTTGPSTRHVLAWHKWLLGWLDADQLTCLTEAGQLEETVSPIETAGGKKLVIMPTDPSTAYALEVRAKVGYDRDICKEGVLLYTIDSQVNNGLGPIRAKSAGGACSPDATPFGVGGLYEDAQVKVEVLATDGRAYRVRITKK